MTEEERRAAPGTSRAALYLALNAALVTVSQLLLKTGARDAPAAPGWLSWTGVAALGSGWVVAGIVCYLLSFVTWLAVLRSVPLHIAYPVTNLSHALIPIAAWALLGERFGPLRAAGIALIIAGTWYVVRPPVLRRDGA